MKMLIFMKCIFVIIICLFSMYMAKEIYQQERATIKYKNPKYVTDVVLFTGRNRRKGAYKTNLTVTILQSWANNVSFEFSYGLKGRTRDIEFKSRVCDSLSTPWIAEFLKVIAGLNAQCPYLPGLYKFYNVELPPKNFPLPLPKGDTIIELSFFLTKTNEMILDLVGALRIV